MGVKDGATMGFTPFGSLCSLPLRGKTGGKEVQQLSYVVANSSLTRLSLLCPLRATEGNSFTPSGGVYRRGATFKVAQRAQPRTGGELCSFVPKGNYIRLKRQPEVIKISKGGNCGCCSPFGAKKRYFEACNHS